ncbi:hypothetical protein FRB99_005256 [Tulasnella sp. 403]|nr:hypothetical protein FRB99_005256 [Tulasnella sp. 403]
MYTQTRGGTRGGAAEFKWSDVSADKDREHYLGHSINAPTGRWQKNKDVHWYARDTKDSELERQEERRKIKEAEAEAMSAALGFGPSIRPNMPSESSGTKSAEEREQEEKQKELEKEEKRRRKEEKRLRKEAKREQALGTTSAIINGVEGQDLVLENGRRRHLSAGRARRSTALRLTQITSTMIRIVLLGIVGRHRGHYHVAGLPPRVTDEATETKMTVAAGIGPGIATTGISNIVFVFCL